MKATVRKGRPTLDEPTDLPDGTEVELMAVADNDDLDDDERRQVQDALARSEEDERQGRVVPAADVLAELRRMR